MSSGIGYRIYTNIRRPDPALVEAFRGIPASNIGDMMGRLYCTNGTIRPLNRTPLLGVAFTVKCPMGDNLMFHRALDLARPGDIIVVDAQGGMERSLAGEMMVQYARHKGLAGFVVDGCMRDDDSIREMDDFPVYCRGLTPQGPYKFGPGEINVPVSIGGQVVLPGDILAGDQDGIVVIRPEDAPLLVDVAREKFNSEQKKLDNYKIGIYPTNHRSTYEALTRPGDYLYID